MGPDAAMETGRVDAAIMAEPAMSQLAARKGGSHFLWVHEQPQDTVGFDVRLEWTAPDVFEIKKGYGFVEGKGRNAILRRSGLADKPAA